jgi:leucyl aminopeptidase
VLDEAEMKALGMGALLGVAQGSAPPACWCWNGAAARARRRSPLWRHLRYRRHQPEAPAGMEDMKWTWAARRGGTMLALARAARANVVGICGLAETCPMAMPAPRRCRHQHERVTIEVINTDAEGRLVLCDALTFVQRGISPAGGRPCNPHRRVIIAALAHEYAGLFNGDDLAAKLTAAGTASGDAKRGASCWAAFTTR